MPHVRWLRHLGACPESIEWAKSKPDAEAAWASCERGDWMLWIAAKCGIDRKLVVLAACACARLSLRHVPADEDRPRVAIETAEAWCRGVATIEQVSTTRRAASSYAAAAAAAYAADAASYAAAAAAADAAYAAADAARPSVLLECADICRRMLPMPCPEGSSS